MTPEYSHDTMDNGITYHQRLPAFTYDIATWFLHVEACWAGSEDITDTQKFHAVIRALPTDVAARISTVLATPPQQDRYEAVKAALISALGRSSESYMAELDTLQFDGRRPSAFLSRMRDLNRSAGSPLSDGMLRYRHSRLLPHPVRLQLSSVRGVMTLQEYAELADNIYNTYTAATPPAPPQLSCVCGNSESVSANSVNNPVFTEKSNANACVNVMRSDIASAQPSTEAHLSAVETALRRIETAVMSQQNTTRSEWCFYHSRFGAAARKCQFPCEYSGNARRGSR